MYDVIIAAAIQQQEQPTQHQTAERSHVWEQLAACLRRVVWSCDQDTVTTVIFGAGYIYIIYMQPQPIWMISGAAAALWNSP